MESQNNMHLISAKDLRILVKEVIQEVEKTNRMSRRSREFFSSKHGQAILTLCNQSEFCRSEIENYLGGLGDSDIKWARIMDHIANELGLIHNSFSTYHEQIRAMIDRMEELFYEYHTSSRKS